MPDGGSRRLTTTDNNAGDAGGASDAKGARSSHSNSAGSMDAPDLCTRPHLPSTQQVLKRRVRVQPKRE
jgi:hypothetical protein